MADVVKFVLELTDKVTPAGKKVQQTLNGIRGGATKFTGAARAATTGTKALGMGALSVAKGFIAAEAAMKALELGKQAVGMVAGAQAMREKTLFAYGILTKSAGEGKRVYDQILRMSQFFGEDPTEALQGFQELIAKGFSANDAIKSMQALGDLKLTSPKANIAAMINAFTQIKGGPKLGLEEIKLQLKDAGLDLGVAYDEIGKLVGIKAIDVEKAISAGKVDSKKGLLGIMNAIMRQTQSSRAGEQMEKFAGTTTGLANALKNLPEQYMLRLNVEGGPFQKVLKTLVDTLSPDSPTGKKILSFLEALGNDFASAVKNIDVDKIRGAIESIAGSLSLIRDAGGRISAAFSQVVGPLTKLLSFNTKATQGTVNWVAVIKGAATAIGVVAGLAVAFGKRILESFMLVPLAIMGAIETGKKLVAWVQSLIDIFKGEGLIAAIKRAGGDIIDGLMAGMKERWDGFINKVKALVNLLPDAVKKTLGIASPSKVFMDLGKHTMSGFEKGVNDNAGGVQAAVNTAVAAPSMGAMAASRTANVSPNIAVTVNVYAKTNAPAGDIADEAATRFENVLSSVVERLAREFGTAA